MSFVHYPREITETYLMCLPYFERRPFALCAISIEAARYSLSQRQCAIRAQLVTI